MLYPKIGKWFRRPDGALLEVVAVDEDDRTIPEHTRTRLLVYRDETNRVRYLELTPFAAAVCTALMVERRAVADGLRAASSSLGEILDDEKLATAAHFLADLAERGVIRGAEPA